MYKITLNSIATQVWSCAHEYDFGQLSSWNENTFLKEWFEETGGWTSGSPGWYWFLTSMTHNDLKDCDRPDTLPKNGCDIGMVTSTNLELFGNLLCQPLDNNLSVVYNGHQGNLMGRIRMHFQLQNQGTGALGLNHHPLSEQRWTVRIFALDHIKELPSGYQGKVKMLINSGWGRGAVESAWRSKNGWPILCKH